MSWIIIQKLHLYKNGVTCNWVPDIRMLTCDSKKLSNQKTRYFRTSNSIKRRICTLLACTSVQHGPSLSQTEAYGKSKRYGNFQRICSIFP